MASKRMFSKELVSTDKFMELSLSAQALYFHLGVNADDDGFVSNPKTIIRMLGVNQKDMEQLGDSKFVMAWESGVILLLEWHKHNFIRSDRYKRSVYLSTVEQKQNYNLLMGEDIAELSPYLDMNTFGIPSDNQRDTQSSIDKVSLDKVSDREREKTLTLSEFTNVKLSQNEHDKLIERFGASEVGQYIERLGTYIKQTGKSYKSHYATILNWKARDEKDKPKNFREKSILFIDASNTEDL